MTLLSLTAFAQSEPYAVLSDGGKTVTFYYDGNKTSSGGIDINNSNISQNSSSPYGTATTAVFHPSFADYRPVSTAYWFMKCSSLTTITGIENLNTSNVTTMVWMFSDCSGLTSLDVSGFNTSKVTNMFGMFYNCSKLTSLDVSGFDTSKVKYMREMFRYCTGLTSLDVSGFNTSNVKTISKMFEGCSGLTSLDVSGFDTSNVTDINSMFCYCSGLTSLDVSGFNTSNVTNMSSMFNGCSGLTSLDVSGFDTSNVTYMACMFSGCSGLTSLDVSGFVTSNVTSMDSMFSRCSGLTNLDLSGFNTSNVTNMSCMFIGCSGLTSLDVSGFDTSNVTEIRYMFKDCSGLTTIYADETKWSTGSVTSSDDMFDGCTSLVGGNGTEYNANHTDAEYARIDKPGQPGYFTSSSSGIIIDKNTFPDDNFRNWVLAQDYGQDGLLTDKEIAAVTEIKVIYKNISNLKGIEYFTALEVLHCQCNQLTSLDVSNNTALRELNCNTNLLTALDVSNTTALTLLDCSWNQIYGAAMDALIAGLPSTGGAFRAFGTFVADDYIEYNVVTKAQVAAAKEKGWTTYCCVPSESSDWWRVYEGSDEQTISPVDEGEVINIGNDIDANTNLDGNVVGDVYYNINDGSYSASEGCIVVNSPTEDSFINGQDIFGDDFKEGYNGIVFMVPAGKGTVKVEAQTTGNMVLKVKIGNNDPIEMVLNGKLTISVPYNVSEDTYVYIYGGTSSAGAKGMKKAAGSGSLKIYGIEVVGGSDGIEYNNRETITNNRYYNLNGQRVNEPTKGVFIRNGKKVLVK